MSEITLQTRVINVTQFAVAIDGPSGAGKSSIAKRVASELGFIYVDTGALYRAIGLYMSRQGINIKDENEVAPRLSGMSVELRFLEGSQHVFLNDEDVSEKIRTPEMAMCASSVSALQSVRAALLELQRDIAAKNRVIMDGRDIASIVLPDAQVKIYLTASAEERARRRLLEHEQRGEKVSFDEILRQIEERDYNDSNRAVAPLKRVPDAILLDTTGYTFEEAVTAVKKLITAAM